MENTEEYQTYSEFEYVSRKDKRKKKRTNKALVDNNAAETSSTLESASGTSLDENATELNDLSVRLSVDASLANEPQYIRAQSLGDQSVQTPVGTKDEKAAVVEESLNSTPVTVPTEFPFINTRALAHDASTYELEKFEKKALIIFNQEVFDTHDPRPGTARDVEALTETFEKFGFDVFPHNNLGKDEIFKELEDFSSQNFTDYGCVAVAVLTHGSEYGTLRARDRQFNEIDIINHFKDYNKPTLVTKPKVIIIQACRGAKISESYPVHQPYSAKIGKDYDEDSKPYLLPVESDMLILHSSYEGKCSIRDVVKGTWFIQELCNKINSLSPDQDLESIVVEVKKEVAINRQYIDRSTKDVNKQMPVMTSTLIRKLYLKKFGDPPSEITYADRHRTGSVVSLPPTVETPNELSLQGGQCVCCLHHFDYMRNCLMHFISDNPGDETAKNYLEVANALGAGTEFNSAKDKMGKVISQYFQSVTRGSHCYRYMYYYKH